MKKLLILIFTLFFTLISYSQDTIVFSNGHKSIGKTMENKKDGKWIWLYENDSLNIIKNYKNGLLAGKNLEYGKNGNLILEGQFINGMKTGKWIKYYNNSDTSYVKNYLNDKYDGIVKSFVKGNKLIRKTNYKKSLKDGLSISYWPSDKTIKSKSVFVNDTLNEFTSYYRKNTKFSGIPKYEIIDNDTLFIKETRIYEQPSKNYHLIYYHYDGTYDKKRLLNNQADGSAKSFFSNGKLKSEGIYKNGNKSGIWRYYNEQGILEKEIKYKN